MGKKIFKNDTSDDLMFSGFVYEVKWAGLMSETKISFPGRFHPEFVGCFLRTPKFSKNKKIVPRIYTITNAGGRYCFPTLFFQTYIKPGHLSELTVK